MIPRHATDVVSLVAGTILTGLTVIWILTVTDTIDLNDAWIGGPITMIVAGAVGLGAAVLRPSTEPAPAYPDTAQDTGLDPQPVDAPDDLPDTEPVDAPDGDRSDGNG